MIGFLFRLSAMSVALGLNCMATRWESAMRNINENQMKITLEQPTRIS